MKCFITCASDAILEHLGRKIVLLDASLLPSVNKLGMLILKRSMIHEMHLDNESLHNLRS